MMKKIIKNPLVALALGLIIIAASSVGATRAAVIYQDNAKEVDFDTSFVSVDVLEGSADTEVKSVKESGYLKFPGMPKDITIGQKYDEYVDVKNGSGEYYEYVRVKVRKYWVKTVDREYRKDTTLNPDTIVLDVDSAWVKNADEHTPEEDVYYLTTPLGYTDEDNLQRFIKGITIDNEVATLVKNEPVKDAKGVEIAGEIKNTYLYNDASFYVELEVNAVQAHNAEKAIYGAWGVRVKCADTGTETGEHDGKIISIEGVATN